MSDDFYGEEPEESYAFYPGFEAVESRPVDEELEDEMNKQATESSKPYDGSIPGVNWAALEVRGQPKDTRDTRKAIVAIKRREFDDDNADDPDKPSFNEEGHGWFNWNAWPFYQTLWADKEAGNTRNDARIARIAAKKALEKVPKETFALDKNKVHQIKPFKKFIRDAGDFGGRRGDPKVFAPERLGEYEYMRDAKIADLHKEFPHKPGEDENAYEERVRRAQVEAGRRLRLLDPQTEEEERRAAAAAEEEERRAAAAAEEEERIANQPGGDDFVGYPEEDGFGGGRKRRRKNRKKKTKKRRYKKKTKKRKNKSHKKTRKSKRRKQTIKRKR